MLDRFYGGSFFVRTRKYVEKKECKESVGA